MRLQNNIRSETASRPNGIGIVSPHEYRAGRSMSPLASVAPWAVAAVAVVALMAVLYGGDARQVRQVSPELPRRDLPSTEMADRLASQQEGINRLAAQVETLATKLAMPNPPQVGAPPEKLLRRPVERRASTATSTAAVEQELDRLRKYAKDVADSIAVIDSQVSDPALLQRKVEQQKATLRPQAQ